MRNARPRRVYPPFSIENAKGVTKSCKLYFYDYDGMAFEPQLWLLTTLTEWACAVPPLAKSRHVWIAPLQARRESLMERLACLEISTLSAYENLCKSWAHQHSTSTRQLHCSTFRSAYKNIHVARLCTNRFSLSRLQNCTSWRARFWVKVPMPQYKLA